MGRISRAHTYNSNTTAAASDKNDNENALFVLVNGNLDKDNVNASADLAWTQLGDDSADAAAQKVTANPGTSTSPSLATDGRGELYRLRHSIERLGTGVDVVRYDGTAATTAMWGDLPARVCVFADSFESGLNSSNIPIGWAAVGSPTVTTPATDTSEGDGAEVNIVTAAANEGISRTFDGLKPSTNYLIVVRGKAATGDFAEVTTSGGASTGSFRNLATSHLRTASTTYVTLAGLVSTDATPTNLVVSLLGLNSADDVSFDHFSLWECAEYPQADAIAEFYVQDNTTGITFTATRVTYTQLNSPTLTCRGTNKKVRVQYQGSSRQTVTAPFNICQHVLQESVNGGGFADVHSSGKFTGGATGEVSVSFDYETDAIPGSTYAYRIQGAGGSGTTHEWNATVFPTANYSSLRVSIR